MKERERERESEQAREREREREARLERERSCLRADDPRNTRHHQLAYSNAPLARTESQVA